MSLRADLIGQRFGKLIALEALRMNREWRWRCQCECGEVIVAKLGNLKSGNTKSCGCLRHEAFIDLVGQTFGRLTVISRNPQSAKNGAAHWLCKCSCGGKTVTSGWHLKSGHTSSCGCLHKERVSEVNKIHGFSRTRWHKVWVAMLDRCYNPQNKSYKNYGRRGITVCERWKSSFENFYKDMGDPPEGMSLDRINNDKGYSPNNCRWALIETQNRNQRRNKNITWRGKTQCIAAWAKEYGISRGVLRFRILNGWEMEKALTIPVNGGK